ncbi:hypothetical Protein YC6258_03761 [Gynuella sunshinyii YC6258]|uniref:Uncharacterized protein n=1 Tax=Gynuella sunshinyii YC6258 TaxID=1445510 RepID=A0A0C5VM67_9GAMM|nr:hypothetical Protein YC6258_03761 [Gynuella sunshinyii YC6258]
MCAFGHSSEAQPLDYLCILPDEIRSLYLTLELWNEKTCEISKPEIGR